MIPVTITRHFIPARSRECRLFTVRRLRNAALRGIPFRKAATESTTPHPTPPTGEQDKAGAEPPWLSGNDRCGPERVVSGIAPPTRRSLNPCDIRVSHDHPPNVPRRARSSTSTGRQSPLRLDKSVIEGVIDLHSEVSVRAAHPDQNAVLAGCASGVPREEFSSLR